MGKKLDTLSKIGKSLFTKNPAGGLKDAQTFFNVPYSLKGGVQKALGIGITGTAVAASLGQVRNVNNMGEISAGGLSDMTQSVKPSAQVKAVQKKGKIDNSLRNTGATGDIVFALHNMR